MGNINESRYVDLIDDDLQTQTDHFVLQSRSTGTDRPVAWSNHSFFISSLKLSNAALSLG
jgi:hypothetical protein